MRLQVKSKKNKNIMTKFLSNERKKIFLSAITGTLLIAMLSCVLYVNNIFIWFLGAIALLVIYWKIPAWFTRNRQLVITGSKYFNADGKEVVKPSSREKFICTILFIAINIFLIIFVYDRAIKILLESHPIYEELIIKAAVILSFSTPYLIRHIYCFVKNIPMDISLKFYVSPRNYSNNFIKTNYSYARSSNCANFSSDPSYSYLPSNIYYNDRYNSIGKH